MSQDIYKKASRLGLRIGNYSVEQLWQMKLQSSSPKEITVDSLAVDLYNELKTMSEVSFVSASNNKSKRNLIELRLDICKDIINTRIKEQEINQENEANRSQLKVLEDALISAKQSELKGLSTTELEQKIKELKFDIKPTL